MTLQHQSYLIFCPDLAILNALAEKCVRQFNPADAFYLREKEGSNTIQVAETLRLTEQANLASVGERKLFIIIDASNMTIAAQNKLLKTIEEIRDSVFLLLATNEERILPTIKSRCVKIYQTTNGIQVPNEVLENARKFLSCKTLDEALPLLPELKQDIPITLIALNQVLKQNKNYAILKTLSIINRNIMAKCNPANAFDLLLMEMFK